MPDRHLPKPHWPRYLGAGAAWLLLGLVVTGLGIGGTYGARLHIDAGYVLLPLAGMLASLRRARRQDGVRRKGWIAFAVGFAGWGLGGVYWAYMELVRRQTPVFPNVSDVGLLSFAVFSAIAMVLLTTQWGPRLRAPEILDAVFIALISAYVVYDLAWSEALAGTSGNGLATIVSIAYSTADTAVLALAVFTLSRAKSTRRLQPALIAGGLGLFVITNSVWIFLTTNGLYVSGSPFDLLWHLAFMLVILGIVHRQVDLQEVHEQNVGLRIAVPPILVVIVAILVMWDASREIIDRFEIILLGILLALLVVRQTVALHQNDKLRREVEANAKALARANERLEEAARFRTQFINATAHELGNPLTPLRIHANLLLNPAYADLQPNRERSVGVMTRSIDRLMRLVRDLLDLSRIEGGSIDIKPRPVELRRLLREQAQLYQPAASSTGVRIEVQPGPSAAVLVDPDRLGQIIGNFLTNAIKYSPPEGRVQVQLLVKEKQVQITVRDQGPGLTPEQVRGLFKPFAQVHVAGTQRPGTGLGLYISRTLADLLKGRVGCESDGPGKGSVFWVELPRASEDAMRG